MSRSFARVLQMEALSDKYQDRLDEGRCPTCGDKAHVRDFVVLDEMVRFEETGLCWVCQK